MRLAAIAVLLLSLQGGSRVAPEPQHFRYQRAVQTAPGAEGRVCAALDGAVYEHSTELTDVRLYADGAEIPYAKLTSQVAEESDTARLMNLGERGGNIVFDLAMPPRPYSAVDLKLNGQDFLATATVTGLDHLGGRNCCAAGTWLGSFTLFDLSGQRLGRNTTLALAESTFPFLHVEVAASAAAGHAGFKASSAMVGGAEVPPSRLAQTLYTTVLETTTVEQRDRETVAVFTLPAHVPVERVSVAINPGDTTNFSRVVRVTARAAGAAAALEETLSGEISRVRLSESGKVIRRESLSVPAILGSNAQTAARVEVAVENGDDKPLPIRAVRLEMRRRTLCFDVPGKPVTMFYGDEKVSAPMYDYARLFRPTDSAGVASLGPEVVNPAFVARVQKQSLVERYPQILWFALISVVIVLGMVALRSAKRF